MSITTPLEDEHIKQLHNIIFILTKNKAINLTINNHNPANTAYIDLEKLDIVLTSQCLPIGIDKYPIAYCKLLDGELVHECGHYLVTRPHFKRYLAVIAVKPLQQLAKQLENIIEDKRINYFYVKFHRLDFGMRLNFLLEITKSSTEATLNKPEKQLELEFIRVSDFSSYLMSLLVMNGLYNCDITKYLEKLTVQQTQDLNELLSILEKVKYVRITLDLIKALNRMYEIFNKYIKASNKDKDISKFVPKQCKGGKLEIELDDKTIKELKDSEETEDKESDKSTEGAKKDKAETLKKLVKSLGKSTGEEIPHPPSDIIAYNALVNRNSHTIARLLDMLKRLMKPKTTRAIYQKRGRMMSSIMARSYASSFRGEVTNIYVKNETHYEKQKVAIAFLFDTSGSVSHTLVQNVMCTLMETFGNYVNDSEFSLACFATNLQRIKSFHEAYQNTRARIPKQNCGGDNNETFLDIIQSYTKQFNDISNDTKKICVIITDFQLLISREAVEQKFTEMLNSKVNIIMMGIDSYKHYINEYLPSDRRIRRLGVNSMNELPELFVKIYTEASQSTR